MPQNIDVSFQLSLGRFPLVVSDEETIREAKRKLRTTFASQLLQVNMNAFRLNVNGQYLSDESKKFKDLTNVVNSGDVLHLVKKNSCAAAALDTEVPADE